MPRQGPVEGRRPSGEPASWGRVLPRGSPGQRAPGRRRTLVFQEGIKSEPCLCLPGGGCRSTNQLIRAKCFLLLLQHCRLPAMKGPG